MVYLHSIESKEKGLMLAKYDDILTFDGVHKSVYEYYYLLAEKKLKPILFVIGDWVGKYDFCDWNEIMDMVNAGAVLGWHSKSHLEPKEAEKLEKIPEEIKAPFDTQHFALPYGRFTPQYLQYAKMLYQNIYGTNLEADGIINRKEL